MQCPAYSAVIAVENISSKKTFFAVTSQCAGRLKGQDCGRAEFAELSFSAGGLIEGT